MALETFPFVAADYLHGWEGVQEFLIASLEDGDVRHIARAFQTITDAPGFDEFAEHIGRSAHELKQQLIGSGCIDARVMLEITEVIGWRFAPIEQAQPEAA